MHILHVHVQCGDQHNKKCLIANPFHTLQLKITLAYSFKAQELELNVYTCGHYATETFGVKALGEEVATKFNLPFQFIDTACPL